MLTYRFDFKSSKSHQIKPHKWKLFRALFMDTIPCFLNFVTISVGQEPVKHVQVGYRSKHVIRKIGWKGQMGQGFLMQHPCGPGRQSAGPMPQLVPHRMLSEEFLNHFLLLPQTHLYCLLFRPFVARLTLAFR